MQHVNSINYIINTYIYNINYLASELANRIYYNVLPGFCFWYCPFVLDPLVTSLMMHLVQKQKNMQISKGMVKVKLLVNIPLRVAEKTPEFCSVHFSTMDMPYCYEKYSSCFLAKYLQLWVLATKSNSSSYILVGAFET